MPDSDENWSETEEATAELRIARRAAKKPRHSAEKAGEACPAPRRSKRRTNIGAAPPPPPPIGKAKPPPPGADADADADAPPPPPPAPPAGAPPKRARPALGRIDSNNSDYSSSAPAPPAEKKASDGGARRKPTGAKVRASPPRRPSEHCAARAHGRLLACAQANGAVPSVEVELRRSRDPLLRM